MQLIFFLCNIKFYNRLFKNDTAGLKFQSLLFKSSFLFKEYIQMVFTGKL